MKQEPSGDLGVNSFPFQSNFDDEFIPSKRVNTGNGSLVPKDEKLQPWSFGPNDYSRDEEKRKQKLKSNDVKKVFYYAPAIFALDYCYLILVEGEREARKDGRSH
jgi:hypothetical protein